MKRRYRLVRSLIDASQYLPARFALLLLQSLSYGLALRIGSALAATICAVDVWHRRVIRENLRLAFAGADLSDSERRRIARAVYRHWGTLMADIPYILRAVHRDNWTSFIDRASLEPLHRLHAEGCGVILVTGHLGNPEFAGWLAALVGLPIHSVANRQTNPRLNGLLERLRTSSGQRILYREDAIRQGGLVLERNEIVAFLADLNAGRQGLSVDFFGHHAPTTRGPAVLSVRTGAPILPVAVVREGAGPRYHVAYAEPIRPVPGAPPALEIHRMTQAYTSSLERFIRLWPEQWVWFHQRWSGGDSLSRSAGTRPCASSRGGSRIARIS
jgi:KDO2-lipid IV(A) lauroyltransferase